MALPPFQASRGAAVKLGRRRGSTANRSAFKTQQILYLLVGITLCATFVVVFFLLPSSNHNSVFHSVRARRFHKRPIQEADNLHNSVAMDVIRSLKCQEMHPSLQQQHNIDDAIDDVVEGAAAGGRRRLAADDFYNPEEESDQSGQDQGGPLDDDASMMDPLADAVPAVNAKHFLCLVAGSPKLPSFVNKDAFHCNDDFMENAQLRQELLEIWSSARTTMPLDLLDKTLTMSQQSEAHVWNENYWLWTPAQDESLEFTQNSLNDEETSSIRDLDVLESSNDNGNGNNALFVDVGSGLGLTTLAIAKRYPSTRILSVEPASPNWLLQSLNLMCNLYPQDESAGGDTASATSNSLPTVVLSGVTGRPSLLSSASEQHQPQHAHHLQHEQMAKMLWRPSMTRLTRTWTSKNESSVDDVELIVKLRTLKSILAEYQADLEEENVNDNANNAVTTRVLNLDCEGCEYNVVPTMSRDELEDFWTTIIGTTGVHWGYIPMDKLPSSKRGETTHRRLCHHYDFARQCIECCAFPDLAVKKGMATKNQDEEQEQLTVKQVAGDLCNGFDDFAERTNLYASNDDYGWTELTSMSDMFADAGEVVGV